LVEYRSAFRSPPGVPFHLKYIVPGFITYSSPHPIKVLHLIFFPLYPVIYYFCCFSCRVPFLFFPLGLPTVRLSKFSSAAISFPPPLCYGQDRLSQFLHRTPRFLSPFRFLPHTATQSALPPAPFSPVFLLSLLSPGDSSWPRYKILQVILRVINQRIADLPFTGFDFQAPPSLPSYFFFLQFFTLRPVRLILIFPYSCFFFSRAHRGVPPPNSSTNYAKVFAFLLQLPDFFRIFGFFLCVSSQRSISPWFSVLTLTSEKRRQRKCMKIEKSDPPRVGDD